MTGTRARVQLTTLINGVIFATVWMAVDWSFLHEYSPWKYLILVLFVIPVALVVLDGVFAHRAISTIKSFVGDLDERTLAALEDSSVFRLQTIAEASKRGLSSHHAKVKMLLVEASEHPLLLQNKHFMKAAHSFNFTRAEAIIRQTKLAAERAAQEALRKEGRRIGRVESLRAEGHQFGLRYDQMADLEPSALRDLIERTREAHALRERAKKLGCSTVIKGYLEHTDLEPAKAFLVRADDLTKRAQASGIEPEVRECIMYDNLEGAEKLLRAKQNETEFTLLKAGFAARIEQLPVPNQPELQKLLDAVSMQTYGSAEYRKAAHALEKKLSTHKV